MKPVMLKEGVILKATDYKEQAELVYILTKDGIENFIIRGAKKISGGTRLLANPLTRISFSGTATEGLNTIIEGIIINSYINIKNNINKMMCVYPIIEKILVFASQVTDGELFYNFVLEILELLSGDLSEELILAIFEVKLTFLIGIAPEIRKCLKCGKPTENGVFSVDNGGCYCEKCKQYISFQLDENETKVFKLLYLVKLRLVDQNLEKIVINDLKKILNVIDLYYQHYFDFTSKAKKITCSIIG